MGGVSSMPSEPEAIAEMAMSCGTIRAMSRDVSTPEESHAGSKTEYAWHRTLGQGAFGIVYAATERHTGTEVAVKVIDLNQSDRTKLQANEVEVWGAIGSHPNIVALHKSFIEEGRRFIAMERCQCIVLDFLRKEHFGAQHHMPWLLREMLLGIQACHMAAIVHRDIKPENFLVGDGGASVKLCDFGLAARLPREGGLRGQYGTAPMMSPEMLRGRRYGASTDMWSFGVTAYTMFFDELPYIPEVPKAAAAKRAVLRGLTPRRLQGALADDKARVAFLLPLLERERDLRACAEEALKHPFLASSSPPDDYQVVNAQDKLVRHCDTLVGDAKDDVWKHATSETTSQGSSLQASSSPSTSAAWGDFV